jgi:hypothetical protein
MQNMLTQACAIICALVCFQLPIFVDQYLLRLEGHFAESQRQIEALTEAAHIGGKTLDQYIAKFKAQNDKDFQNQGVYMQRAVDRNRFLEGACVALQEAGPFSRPFVFIRYVDSEVVADAWNTFTPGFSPTLHVALFGAIGWLLGWTVSILFRRAVMRE